MPYTKHLHDTDLDFDWMEADDFRRVISQCDKELAHWDPKIAELEPRKSELLRRRHRSGHNGLAAICRQLREVTETLDQYHLAASKAHRRRSKAARLLKKLTA